MMLLYININNLKASVAQLDRAPDYGSFMDHYGLNF